MSSFLLFVKFALPDVGNDDDDEAIITSINELHQDLKANHTKIEDMQHRYQNLENELNRLKEENQALQQQNEELIQTKKHFHDIPESRTETKEIEIEFPKVIRIDIDGGWLNKKTRAIIQYKDQIIARKMADFKWFYKMMQINGGSSVIPTLPKELPHAFWPKDYLIKRKHELTEFLKQCHSISNTKNSKPYDIFLEKDKKKWKQRRNIFDKEILLNIRQS